MEIKIVFFDFLFYLKFNFYSQPWTESNSLLYPGVNFIEIYHLLNE